MKEYKKLDQLLDFLYRDKLRAIKYRLAKKWLDENFGEQEYWGEVISEWRNSHFTLEDMKIARKDN